MPGFLPSIDVVFLDANGYRQKVAGATINLYNETTSASAGTVTTDANGIIAEQSVTGSAGNVMRLSHATYPGLARFILGTTQADAYTNARNTGTTYIADDLTTTESKASDADIYIRENVGSEPVKMGTGRPGETVKIPYQTSIAKTIKIWAVGRSKDFLKTEGALDEAAGVPLAVPSSGLSVGSAVTGGGVNRVLHQNASGNLGADADFTYNGTTNQLTVGTAVLFSPNSTSVFLGQGTGNTTLTGTLNAALGYLALASLTTGTGNTAFGTVANYLLETGSYNIGLGYEANRQNVAGHYNIGIGAGALYNNTASYNIGIGDTAGYATTSGTNNVFIGSAAGRLNTVGAENVAIGGSAGYSLLGSGNVMLGYAAGYSETGSNKLYIANSTTTTPLIYGEFPNGRLNLNTPIISQRFDASNRMDISVSATGGVTFDAVGTGAKFNFSDVVGLPSMADASASNSSLYYSTTASKLVWKDSAGVVNALY